ncbi:hypothetical protein RO3G_12628 [Rhizopus delemar RA 99-880]|uniref:Uncharacterized protein n=1 Tax=Rhizopus delemar (strain RA 99-880 / ATCC MYA-4621 / FGSC 9543 / NRRL 43880) TaxID=246409 RepID=I1CHI7_RHIO9|nr:hypothetical protein RO3G_12628 [Rhizopus delemar RA 99-880]|eukprot:EIE87917.1 hypothetical protein RO3G_12628 [Rhizopus delemar RA 99-880]
MEDINKAANAPSVIHMNEPSESSTEALAALASFISRAEITSRIINITIWTTTSMRPIAIQVYIRGQKVLLPTKDFYEV